MCVGRYVCKQALTEAPRRCMETVSGGGRSCCVSLVTIYGGSEKSRFLFDLAAAKSAPPIPAYLELVYFVTAFVPSETACLASSPGSRSRTAVCISRLVMVERRL